MYTEKALKNAVDTAYIDTLQVWNTDLEPQSMNYKKINRRY